MLISVIVSGVVFFITYTLEVITGFGGAVLAMPFVTSLVGMREGVMVVTCISWALALYIVITNRKKISWPQFIKMFGFMLLGLPIGMYFFRKFDVDFLKRVLAVFIISAALWHLFMKLFFKKRGGPGESAGPGKGWKAIPYYLILAGGGIIHGMLSSGGPLVVIYASKVLPGKDVFRATLALVWASLNTIIIVMYAIEKSFTPRIAGTLGTVSPFIILGIVIGEKIHKKLDERFFSVLVFIMLFAAGCVIMFRG